MQTIYLTPFDNGLMGKMRRDEEAYTVFCDTSLGSFSVNLPRVSEMAGKDIVFKKDSSANTVTLNAVGEYIETAQNYEISEPDSHARMVADLTKYRLLSYGNGIIIGHPMVNGSWRFIISSSDLIVERRESGTWVEKHRFTAQQSF